MKNVKKIISLIMAVLMSASIFAGCSKSTAPDAFKGKLMEPYIEIIQTGAYTYETTPEDETPITYSKVGDEKKMVSLTVDDTKITYMLLNGTYYILIPGSKIYTEATETQIEQYGMDDLFDSLELDAFVNATFVEEGTTSYQAVEYSYEDYYNPLVQIKNRFLFDDRDTLCYLEKLDEDGKVTRVTPISLYEINETSFDILSNYSYYSQSTTTTKKTTTKASSDKDSDKDSDKTTTTAAKK